MFFFQGTYALVETIISEKDIAPAGEQLVILIGSEAQVIIYQGNYIKEFQRN